MTHDEMIAVIKAHKEGKTIQWKHKANPDAVDWKDAIELSPEKWDFRDYDYRIKPEPHYRPFENAKEVMEAIKEHGSWFKLKESGDMYQVVGLVNMILILGQDGMRNCKEAFDIFTFTDGTPFGVKEG